MELKAGFLKSLFDFSFTEFVTTKIIKVLYGIAVFFAGLASIALIVSGFRGGIATGVLLLILSPVIFFLIVIYARVLLEVLIVLFRIAEHTGDIAKQTRKES